MRQYDAIFTASHEGSNNVFREQLRYVFAAYLLTMPLPARPRMINCRSTVQSPHVSTSQEVIRLPQLNLWFACRVLHRPTMC